MRWESGNTITTKSALGSDLNWTTPKLVDSEALHEWLVGIERFPRFYDRKSRARVLWLLLLWKNAIFGQHFHGFPKCPNRRRSAEWFPSRKLTTLRANRQPAPHWTLTFSHSDFDRRAGSSPYSQQLLGEWMKYKACCCCPCPTHNKSRIAPYSLRKEFVLLSYSIGHI